MKVMSGYRVVYQFVSLAEGDDPDVVSDGIWVSGERCYDGVNGYGFFVDESVKSSPECGYPELNTGFTAAGCFPGKGVIEQDFRGCRVRLDVSMEALGLPDSLRIPLSFKAEVGQAGNYRLSLLVYSDSDDEVMVFAGRRQLVFKGQLAAGRFHEISCLDTVYDIVPRGTSERFVKRSVEVTLIGRKVYLAKLMIEEWDGTAVFIAGDSTVADQSAQYPYDPDRSYCGWGQMLPYFLKEFYAVSNHAHSGLTTESFRSEGHFEIMMDYVKAGDFCLFQFGHNDQKLGHLQARGGYRENLCRYIRDIRAKGANPVLVTPLARNSWKSGGRKYHDLLKAYHDAVVDLGREEQVAVLDLHTASVGFILEQGLENAKRWFYPSDYTHTNDFGGYQMAQFVWKEMLASKVFTGVEVFEPERFVPPEEGQRMVLPEVLMAASGAGGENGGTWFRKEMQPGDPVTRADAVHAITARVNFFPINVYNDLFGDVIGHEWYAGSIECAVQNELIPEQMVVAGKFFPEQLITLEEFLWIAMTAYQSRKQLPLPKVRAKETLPWTETLVSTACEAGIVANTDDWKRILLKCEADRMLAAFEI